jgi:hypothetical protein
LNTDDVPQAATRNLLDDVTYPRRKRYTLQWLWQLPPTVTATFPPQNSDATFKKGSKKPKPSELILHYNYAAAAVTQWGVSVQALSKVMRPNLPRPTTPVPAPMQPARTVHDHSIAITKIERMREGQASSSAADAEVLEEEEDAPIEADEVVLFFWGNTKVATERRRQATDDQARRMEQWNSGGSYV